MHQATFDPDAYKVRDLEEAKIRTVGDLGNSDTDIYTASEARWVSDTAYTLEFILGLFPLGRSSHVLDYGCGTGRISRGMIHRSGCDVVGVDASASMRDVAAHYVASRSKFRTCPNSALLYMKSRFDFAICLWVLQHSGLPTEDVGLIHSALRPGGRLLVFNELLRFVPTKERGFVHDGIDVRKSLEDAFGPPAAEGRLDPTRVHPLFSQRTWWAEYRKSHDNVCMSIRD